MKPFFPLVAILIIVSGGFFLGMQFGAEKSATLTLMEEDSDSARKVVPVIIPLEDISTETDEIEIKEDIIGTEEATAPLVAPPEVPMNTSQDPQLPLKKSETVNRYESARFRYGFDIPANVYYSAFPPENGAVHTIGISKEDPATLLDSAVRVYFYGTKIVPELQGQSELIDPAGTYIYKVLNGSTIKIEALNINHHVVQKILETLEVF